MKRDRVVIRSSSRPDEIGKEQSIDDIDDKDKHSYHSTAYKYFINAVTKLVSYYNLWGIS